MEQYPASIDANDTAVNFLEHIDAAAIEYLAFEVAAFQEANPEGSFPTINVSVTDVNPREAGALAALHEQADALGVPLGIVSATVAPELPDESLQGLSVAEAVAALGYLPSLSADKITISDTLEEIIENAHQFVSPGLLVGLAPDAVTAENVAREDINEAVGAKVGGVNLIGSIELAEHGDFTSPVNIETALSLVDDRVENAPTPSTLLIEASASEVLAQSSLFEAGGALETATNLQVVDAKVADLDSLFKLDFVTDVSVSDTLIALEGDAASLEDASISHMRIEGASLADLGSTAIQFGSASIVDSVQNILDAIESGNLYLIDFNGSLRA